MGRGSSKISGSGGYNATVNDLANSLMRDISAEDVLNGDIPMSNSDLQAVVEAFAMTHKGVNEDKMLNDVRDLVETKSIEKDIKEYNTKAYDIEMNGEKSTLIFQSNKGTNYYMRNVGDIPEPTPNNMSAKEMINRAEGNGAKVKSVKNKDLVDRYKKHAKDRREANELLDRENVRNKGADWTHKEYRNYKRATRRSR